MSREWGEGKRLLFIGGAPRSGTTLLRRILNAHSDIAAGPEFDNVPKIVRLRNTMQASLANGRIDTFVNSATLDQYMGTMIENCLLPYAEKHNANILAEKTPWNVLVIKELLEIFPQAHFIVCLRDPRAVIASMLAVGERVKQQGLAPCEPFTRKLFAAIKTVQRCQEAGVAWADHERVFVLRYEEIVSTPKQEVKRICDFLSLRYEPDMLKPNAQSHDTSNVKKISPFYTEKMLQRNIEKTGMDKWMTHLSSTQQQLIALAYANKLGNIGYAMPLNATIKHRLLFQYFQTLDWIENRLRNNRILRKFARRLS